MVTKTALGSLLALQSQLIQAGMLAEAMRLRELADEIEDTAVRTADVLRIVGVLTTEFPHTSNAVTLMATRS